VVTGWYSEFDLLEDAPRDGRVPYGAGPARFAGSTYDPASNYRAAEVFVFFREMKLTAERLRVLSQHQVARLAATFDALDEDPHVISRDPMPLESIAGFLALQSPRAGDLSRRLRAFGVFSDYRGSTLRLGPAPYVTDDQLDHAIAALGEAARAV
jgi:kynureninase